jgi:flagellar basal-body rod protein FlgG
MPSALHIAKTGLDALQTRMSVISNNLANVGTTGYKKGRTLHVTNGASYSCS